MVVGAVALVAVALYGEYYFRCHGKPLSREEAFQRATDYLQQLSQDFVFGDPPPALVEEQYDAQTRGWTFKFVNSTCTIYIIADRCQGTEVGGLSEGCRVR